MSCCTAGAGADSAAARQQPQARDASLVDLRQREPLLPCVAVEGEPLRPLPALRRPASPAASRAGRRLAVARAVDSRRLREPAPLRARGRPRRLAGEPDPRAARDQLPDVGGAERAAGGARGGRALPAPRRKAAAAAAA
eukprot:CAMPEP_0202794236 /NCGR_PEP_ID=MMETSP1388-20130828/87571_1 /ASSEMBLY_ACC=CAM_ASM_000864 /TAXON_ID=37098 /ORGANISM="Isochrysis sp, Strain CCMP1244" /LENGTH=138 /DNA_ID=CAMNT_0049464071 /DNA_START=115 /DNA_END=528 /DNA_ORIENTATION=+